MTMVVAIMVSACALNLVAMSTAIADPDPTPPAPTIPPLEPAKCDVIVSAEVDETQVYITGAVRARMEPGAVGVTVAVSMGKNAHANVTTGNDGSFSHAFPRPTPGTYAIKASWAGNAEIAAASAEISFEVPEPPKAKTQLTVTVDPREVVAGQAVQISGTLMSDEAPVPSTMLSLTASYGNLDQMAVTDKDGKYVAVMSIPADDDFPDGYSVTVRFSGDSVYEESQGRVSGSIKAAPKPEKTPKPSKSASPTPSATPTSTESVLTQPTSTPSGAAVGDDTSGGSKHIMVIEIIFLAVAFVAVGSLLVIGIVSHGKKSLERGERRGFGSDFGKDTE